MGDGATTGAFPRSFGRYELVGVLGHGAMGTVYDARDPALGRAVAIKVLRSRGANVIAEERFRREALALARVQHPNVVVVFEAGSVQGQLFVAVEKINGRSLATLLEAAVPRERLLDAVEQAARGLHAAHLAGVVHRDVKPANIVVAEATWRACVVDFGIAQLEDAASISLEGALLGSPVYMAPEQVRAGGAQPDPRVDVFGLGATLYEVLTGAPPRTSLEQLLDTSYVVAPPRERDPSLSQAVALVCERALARDPGARFPSAEAFADALAAARVPRRKVPGVVPALVAVGVVAAIAVSVGRDAPRTPGAPPLLPPSPVAHPSPTPAGPTGTRAVAAGSLGSSAGRHAGKIGSATVSRDGQRVLSVGPDALRVWEAASGRAVATIDPAPEIAAFVGPDGHRAAVVLPGGEVAVFDLDRNARPSSVVLPNAENLTPVAVAASDDGKVALVLAKAGRLWAVELATRTVRLLPRDGHPVSLAISPDGSLAATGTLDGGLTLWDVAAGKPRATYAGSTDAKAPMRLVAFSADGRRVAAATSEGSVLLWDVAAPAPRLFAETPRAPSVAIAFGGAGDLIHLADASGVGARVKLVSATTVPEPHVVGPRSFRIHALSPDGSRAFGTEEGGSALQCRDVTTGGTLWGGGPGHTGRVTALAVATGGARLVSVARDRTLRTWSTADARELGSVVAERALASVALDPGGTRGLALDETGQAVAYALSGEAPLAKLPAPIAAATVLADGGIVTATGAQLVLQPAGDGPPRTWPRPGRGNVVALALAADATLVVSDGGDTLELWDVATGRQARTLRIASPAGAKVAALAAAPGSGWLLVGLAGEAPVVVDLASGGVTRLPGPEARALALDATSGLAATADERGTVSLWSLPSGAAVDFGQGRGLGASALAFSPGAALYVGTESGVILAFALR